MAGFERGSVTLRNVYGPLEVTVHNGWHKGFGEKCTLGQPGDRGWPPGGAIFVPGWVDVEGQHLYAAQFLRDLLAITT